MEKGVVPSVFSGGVDFVVVFAGLYEEYFARFSVDFGLVFDFGKLYFQGLFLKGGLFLLLRPEMKGKLLQLLHLIFLLLLTYFFLL